MEKRKNPVMEDESSLNVSSITKRVNPLVLDPNAEAPEAKVEAKPAAKFVPFCISPETEVKRSFVFTRVSKDILKSVKEIDDEKLGIIIENALLEKLHTECPEKYEEVIKLLTKGE